MKLSTLLISLCVLDGMHGAFSQQRGASKAVRGSTSHRPETSRILMGKDKGDEDGGDDTEETKPPKEDKKGGGKEDKEDKGDKEDKKGGGKGDKEDKKGGGKGDDGGDGGDGGSVEGDYTISHAGVSTLRCHNARKMLHAVAGCEKVLRRTINLSDHHKTTTVS